MEKLLVHLERSQKRALQKPATETRGSVAGEIRRLLTCISIPPSLPCT